MNELELLDFIIKDKNLSEKDIGNLILNNNIETITTQNIFVFCIYTIIILALATRMFRKNEK